MWPLFVDGFLFLNAGGTAFVSPCAMEKKKCKMMAVCGVAALGFGVGTAMALGLLCSCCLMRRMMRCMACTKDIASCGLDVPAAPAEPEQS